MNVISEFIRPQPDSRVVQWLDATGPESLFVSVVTFGKIRLGIEDLLAGKRRDALEEWLDQGLPGWFDSHLLPVTKPIAAKKKGVVISTADGLIAATALEHDLAIVTRNVSDFATCGAAIINPWEV